MDCTCFDLIDTLALSHDVVQTTTVSSVFDSSSLARYIVKVQRVQECTKLGTSFGVGIGRNSCNRIWEEWLNSDVGPPTQSPTRAMTIREIGGIRGMRRPIESVGTARVSRNVDLIASGGGIGRRCAAAPPYRRLLDARILFCTIVWFYNCYLCAELSSFAVPVIEPKVLQPKMLQPCANCSNLMFMYLIKH